MSSSVLGNMECKNKVYFENIQTQPQVILEGANAVLEAYQRVVYLGLKDKHVFVLQKVIVLFIIFLKFLWLVWYHNMHSVGMSYFVYVFLYINKVFIFNLKKNNLCLESIKLKISWRKKKIKLEIQSKEYMIREKAKRREKK